MDFDDLNIQDEIKKAIGDMGFTKLTPIQKRAIPDALKSIDLICQAQTGSGKTLAFAIPVLNKIFIPDRSPQAIVLCPTRELCMQVAGEITKAASKMKKLKVLAVYGGQPIGKQTRVLKKGVHVVVGTPGRVIDHIERGNLDLIGVESVVLDEADEMLEMGFREDIEFILAATPRQRQTMLFSATIPSDIRQIGEVSQKDPKFSKITSTKKTAPKIAQYYIECDIKDKFDSLCRLLDIQDSKLILIFCNTKKSVNYISKHLKKQEYLIDAIHGDMTQKARDKVMNKFRNGNISILVASDVAARGLDISGVDVVINYDVAQNSDDYTHRIGRTARAGKSGEAFNLVSSDEIPRFNKIKKSNKISKREIPTHGEIEEFKNNLILKEALKIIENENIDEYEKIIKRNDLDSSKIAGAFLKMLRQN